MTSSEERSGQGFRFHQDEVRLDPRLLARKTKTNYLDSPLPEGWELRVRAGSK